MSNELATVGGGYSAEQIDLIKNQICKGANDHELKLFLMVCQRTGLDPFSRQVHAVKRWNAKTQREDMSIQTGIDGFRLIAERTGKYAGNDDPVYDVEDARNPGKATVTVWKMVNGQRVAFTRSARWSEFVQTTKDGRPTKFWEKMPYLMLGKVAEALALRTAFPQDLSGLYTVEEMGQADNDAEVMYEQSPPVVKQLPAAKPQSQPPQQQQQPAPATVNPDGPAQAVSNSQTAGELEAAVFAAKALYDRSQLDAAGMKVVCDAVQAKVLALISACHSADELKSLGAVYQKSILPLMNPARRESIGVKFDQGFDYFAANALPAAPAEEADLF